MNKASLEVFVLVFATTFIFSGCVFNKNKTSIENSPESHNEKVEYVEIDSDNKSGDMNISDIFENEEKKELFVEWKKPEIFNDFEFPKVNNSYDSMYLEEKATCKLVGSVKNKEYKGWHFILCEKSFGQMGYKYKMPYRIYYYSSIF